jgi:uncharacterized iron-regulated membrane protein
MIDTILYHPQKLLLRRVLFQIHLWAGIFLSLYLIVISLSGSILVFQDEIRLASLPHTPLDRAHVASIDTVIAQAQAHFPAQRLIFVSFPQQDNPWWTLHLSGLHGKPHLVYADSASGTPLVQQRRLLIDVVHDLHVYLLAGQTGFAVNCIAGMGLLLLAITGAVLWWPGIRLWKHRLTVSLRHGWKRVNYDLHSAAGFWTLAIVSWWGITAVYFLFPRQVSVAVNAISPLVGMKPPAMPSPPVSSPSVASLGAIMAALPPVTPEHLSGVALPSKPGGAVTLYIDRQNSGDFSHRDIFTFDGHSGKLLTVWHYGQNHSLGDWVIWLMHPLHFGTLWGRGVKVLWSLLGLSVSLLSATGLLMYWNRKLSKWCANLPRSGRSTLQT